MQSEPITYMKDSSGIYVYVSPNVIQTLGHVDASDIVGHSDLEMPGQNDNVLAWIEEDKRIMKTRKSEHVINQVYRKGELFLQRTYKSPMIGRNGKIQGISGASINISKKSLIALTKQQTACLKNLALGYTHKQIARELGLAQKTIEHYLDAVKLKLNCKSRSELILQAIERGLVGVF